MFHFLPSCMLCVVYLFGVTQGQDFIQEDQNHNEILNNHEEVCSEKEVELNCTPKSVVIPEI